MSVDAAGSKGGPRICVSVAPGEPGRVPDALRATRGADVVELRLDALPVDRCTEDALRAWIAASPVPVIVTCRRRRQGGAYRGSEAVRRAILETALRCGARWIDVELEAQWATEVVTAEGERVLLSHHWDVATPPDLDTRLGQLLALRPAIGKLVAPAERPQNAAGLLAAGRALAAAGILPACFAMGEQGRASRLIAALDGGLLYAAADRESATAPGQWRLQYLRSELAAGRWTPSAVRYALVGDPLEHSLSPAIFNAAFVAAGRDACYVPLPGGPFAEVLSLAQEAGFRGLSVTMPYKGAAAAACVRLSSLAERAGTANTLVRVGDGWEGHNTDGPAVVAALSAEIAVDGARVVLLGTGGAGRAAAFALRDAGAELVVLNRTVARARELAAEVGAADWGDLDFLGDWRCDALVNATPVGMDGTARTPVSTARLQGGEVVLEMIYRPRQTALLREAASRGCRVIPGVEMFLNQARAQHEIWFGEDPPAGAMREAAIGRLDGSGVRGEE